MSLTPTTNDYVISNGLKVLGSSQVTSSTNQVGSLQVNGGGAIAKNLYVGTDAFVGGNTDVIGDITVKQDAIVDGAITVGQDLTNVVVPAIYSNNMLVSTFISPTLNQLTEVNLDFYSASTYRTVKYTAQITSGANIHSSELLIFHDNSSVYLTEYGVLTNNGELGTYDAVLQSQVVTLKFTPATTSSTVVKVVRIGITV